MLVETDWVSATDCILLHIDCMDNWIENEQMVLKIV